MRRIVLATIGSLGDLHPFIAIGLALRERGHRVLLAVPEDHVAKVRAAGLDAAAIMPSFDTIRQQIGLSDEDAVKRIMGDQAYLLDKILVPYVEGGVAALDALLADADIVVSSLFVFAAPIAAEKRGLPLVNVVLQPATLFSREDPPHSPDFRFFVTPAPGRMARWWNNRAYRLLHRFLRYRYGRRIDRVRAAHGLPASTGAPLIDSAPDAMLTLCCYSPVFASLPADAPVPSEAVGFAIFDSENGAPSALDPALDAFLDAGPPPLVFTLGSFAVFAPGNFYVEAARTARLLGRRAVLLIGDGPPIVSDDSLFVCAYAPHSLLFPRAAAVIHHGGMGTTGQALRAGKPQLVVPHMGDQYDNGARIERLGVGRVTPTRTFTAPVAARLLQALLSDPAGKAEAARIGTLVSAENGAMRAAVRVEQLADSMQPMAFALP